LISLKRGHYLFFFLAAGFFAAAFLAAGFFALAFMVFVLPFVNPNDKSRIGFDSVGTLTNLVRINPVHKRNFPVTPIGNFDR
jgi:hypothetical protein